jgi:hypothetical protein
LPPLYRTKPFSATLNAHQINTNEVLTEVEQSINMTHQINKRKNAMSLLQQYKNADVVGFSFSPIHYQEEKIMQDEPEFKSIDAPKIEGDYVLSWEDYLVIGDLDYIFTWINSQNFHVHACIRDGVTINLEIHDYDTLWYESLSPVTANQYKDEE